MGSGGRNRSAHPIAQPIVMEATRFGRLPCIEPARLRQGRGVEAACAAHAVAVGSLELMREIGVKVPSAAASTVRKFGEDGKTAVVAALDGKAMGVLAVADEQRESARPMLEQIRKTGIGRIAILTGDDPRTAGALARKLEIREVHAGLLPDAKLDLVRRMQAEGGTVAMVGDGINDARQPPMSALRWEAALRASPSTLPIS
jgi:P-type E1-E2 ATPase